jgi:2-iminoacetate synthase ThiH
MVTDLTQSDCSLLYDIPLDELGKRAATVRFQRHGAWVDLLFVGRLEYSNVCHNSCCHCLRASFGGKPEGITLDPEEVGRRAAELYRRGITVLELLGGSNPALPLAYHADLVAAAHDAAPGIDIEGFTPQIIHDLARANVIPIEGVLQALIDAGLTRLAGDGGEVFSHRIRTMLSPTKITGGTWLRVMIAAHEMGMKSTASMTFGYHETVAEKAEHLALLGDVQDETGGFTAYWPEPPDDGFHTLPLNGEATGEDILRELAVARLSLDSFEHIRCLACPSLSMEDFARAPAYGADQLALVTCCVATDEECPEPRVMPDDIRGMLEAAGWQLPTPTPA